MYSNIVFYNSISKKKEVFKSINHNFVGIYVCGPTVYGPPHIGHARSSVTFDILIRYLKYRGYKVKFIRNYTDVGHLEHDADEGDDKIEKQARKEKIDPMEIAQKYINLYRYNMDLLNCLNPNIEPQATGYIQDQIEITSELIKKGYAYEVNGSVYFDVKKYNNDFKKYGILSGRKIEELYTETRELKNQNEKKNNFDFALWKKADEKHIMKWQSPWSIGFPGWHTECVVLSKKYLGELFDIHGGGIDLKFPHHEAEIAQANAAYGTNLANFWIHNNLVNINNQKMSKSLNNFITLDDLFFDSDNMFSKNYDPMVLRFLFLETHYRNTLSLTKNALESAEKGYLKLKNAVLSIKRLKNNSEITTNTELANIINEKINQCFDYLDDDLNTSKALANIFELVNIINDFEFQKVDVNLISKNVFESFKKTFVEIYENIFGFKNIDQNELLSIIIDLYSQAKKDKNYEYIDLIREKLKKQNLRIADFNAFSIIKY